ncbi:MAG TPA: DUF2911 domain-containing protein [Gemmatimonadaceae bacterium]|nr:DUF2911 domain-containing protein [Gemmatimonadaceae bacterium]
MAFRPITIACLGLSVGVPFGVASGQAIASPRSSITQLIDSTTITIEYYRPSVRGREIFGKLVRWGSMWTPGANWATTLEVDRDVRIDGHPLPRGKYSLWMIPTAERWTVVLSRQARRFHVMRPQQSEEQLRFDVRPRSGPPTEVLSFSFPEVSRTAAILQMQWAGTVVPMAFEIAPSRPPVVAAHPASSYTGSYSMRYGTDAKSPAHPFEIVERGSSLWVRTSADGVEPGLDPDFDLEPMGGDEFHPRQYRNGTLIGVEADEVISFRLDGDRATGFELRGVAEQKVLGRGTRVRP